MHTSHVIKITSDLMDSELQISPKRCRELHGMFYAVMNYNDEVQLEE